MKLTKPPAETGLTLGEAIVMWERHLATSNRTERTRRTYAYATAQLTGHIDPQTAIIDVHRSDIEALVANLQSRGWKPASVSAVVRPLRSFFGWAVTHPDVPLSVSPMQGMPNPTIPQTVVQFPSDDELRRILATTASRSRHAYRAHRDAAIIRVLASTGMRLSECATLRLVDVDLPACQLRVRGKGQRERWTSMDEGACAALRLYLDKERPRSPYHHLDAVWLSPKGAMSASGIAQMYASRCKAAGVVSHVHALRHRFIATLLGAGLSEGDVMALSGHRSRSMMDRYGAWSRAERARDAYRRAQASGAVTRL